jgi:glycerol-3-phosphate dehydrogenase subunit C
MSKNISYLPTDGLSYDPSEDKYWDKEALDKETERIFEVCHGCRMCFKYCDSFPDLFSFIDDRHDGDVSKITEAETRQVVDSCFQCKLCEVECPYTPRDGHEFQLDFPKLVHRHRAHRAKEEGLTLRDKLMGNPDLAGSMARMSLGLANTMNRVAAHRYFMELFLGIHREKDLPHFASSTFEKWATAEGLMKDAPSEDAEAVLYQTCYVQNNEPQIGRDCVEVMDKNSVRMDCAKGLGCCGMPSWEKGDLATLQKRAKENLDRLGPWVEKGAKILVVNPTCSMMMRQEYPELLEGEDRQRAEKLSEAVMDISEFLWTLRKEERFNRDFKSSPGNVAYHAPCHLRAQAKGFKGRDLIKQIPGPDGKKTKPAMVMECCGHDGTFAMTVEGFEPSIRAGRKAFSGMQEAEAEVWATDCPLAAIQFKQHAGVRPMHPMSVLASAYRPEGFKMPLANLGKEKK